MKGNMQWGKGPTLGQFVAILIACMVFFGALNVWLNGWGH